MIWLNQQWAYGSYGINVPVFAAWYHAPLAQTDFSGDLRETGKIELSVLGTFVMEYIDQPQDHLVMHYTKPVDRTPSKA